jgi:hypothetical protein
MMLPPLVLQTAGSLVAILALAALARWMKLGGDPRLTSDEAARRVAGEVEYGFAPVIIARDKGGLAAVARDAGGRIMVIQRHGNRFVGRVLGPRAKATLNIDLGETLLVVQPSEALFGDVYLEVDDPRAWVATINQLSTSHHA